MELGFQNTSVLCVARVEEVGKKVRGKHSNHTNTR